MPPWHTITTWEEAVHALAPMQTRMTPRFGCPLADLKGRLNTPPEQLAQQINDSDVPTVVLFTSEVDKPTVRFIYDMYHKYFGKLTLGCFSLDKNPERAKKYGLTSGELVAFNPHGKGLLMPKTTVDNMEAYLKRAAATG